ncbi:MAG: carbohydrate ABC transporter permease [Rhodospirillales bacterium]|nr:carbohydrate ABC transporter permease [Rhodospirillales bacterium]
MTGATTELSQTDWDALARRSKRKNVMTRGALITFLIIVTLPVLLPYFWMFAISFSAKTGGVATFVLWRASAILVPAVIAIGLTRLFSAAPKTKNTVTAGIVVIAVIALAVLVGPYLHLENYRFFWEPNFVADLPSRMGDAGVGPQFPWVWEAFGNSLMLATAQTVIVGTVSTFAGYYLSRFAFPGRGKFLQGLLVLHAFPAMTLVIPIFLIMYWVGLIDTITGVMLVIVTLELPFSIFIMKGFFDAVPWDIEMSAMADGASRRQAFFQVVLPQVQVGLIAIGVFAFIKGWEEYVFVRTLLFEKSNWMMSLYLFWVADDIMGVDYGIVAAVGVFYVMPSVLLYLFFQKYLTQLNIGGVKG